jgi:hypothetical protein
MAAIVAPIQQDQRERPESRRVRDAVAFGAVPKLYNDG